MELRRLVTVTYLGLGITIAHAQSAVDIAARTGGNLRIDVSCADYWGTPDHGLQLTVDGAVEPAVGTNGVDAVGYTKHGNPYVTWQATDIGYALAPGMHHLELAAPGCESQVRDVEIWPALPRSITGRLAVADSSLKGPVGAPDGIGLALGAFGLGRPAHGGDNLVASTSYAYDAGTVDGGYLSISYEHRGFVAAWDVRLGVQSTSGTAMAPGMPPYLAPAGPLPFTGTEISFGNTLRLGARLPLHDVALEAGSGVGGDFMGSAGGSVTGSNLTAPNGVDLDWFVPLWAAATIKPGCNWGVQVLASYEVHPTSLGDSAFSLGAGLMWQPSASCSEPAGLAVR